MTVGARNRMKNKHMKIVLRRGLDSKYVVEQTVNTLVPAAGDVLNEIQAQEYVDNGYTVTVKGIKK